MIKGSVVVFIFLGIVLGFSISQIYQSQKNLNISSMCYTDLQPSNYFTQNSYLYGRDIYPVKIEDNKIQLMRLNAALEDKYPTSIDISYTRTKRMENRISKWRYELAELLRKRTGKHPRVEILYRE